MPGGSIGDTVGGIVGSVFGTTQADAAEDAAKIQARSGREALDSNERMLERSIGIRQPFIDLGSDLAPTLQNRLTNPTTRSDIVNNDLFQSLFNNATRTINAKNAAGKGIDSGQNYTDLINASLGIGNQLYQQDTNNLLNAVSLGSNAASGAANNVSNTAAQNSNLITGIGNVLGGGKVGAANAYGQGLNNLISIGRMARGGF
jgi:hypothetical protein